MMRSAGGGGECEGAALSLLTGLEEAEFGPATRADVVAIGAIGEARGKGGGPGCTPASTASSSTVTTTRAMRSCATKSQLLVWRPGLPHAPRNFEAFFLLAYGAGRSVAPTGRGQSPQGFGWSAQLATHVAKSPLGRAKMRTHDWQTADTAPDRGGGAL